MAQHLREWPDYGVIEEQMKETAILPKIEPEQVSKSLALSKSPHTHEDPPSVVFPDISSHIVTTYDSYTPPVILRSAPPDLWSPVSSANSPHSPSTRSPRSPSDILRPVSSTNPSRPRPTNVRTAAGDLPTPASSTNSPHTPSDLLRPYSSTNYSYEPFALKSPPPDLSTPVSSTNSPHAASDLQRRVSPIEGPYPPSAPPDPGLNSFPSHMSFNTYPQTSPDLTMSMAYNKSSYTRPRIPGVQQQGPPRLVTNLYPPVESQTQADHGEYQLSPRRALTEFPNFPSQDFSPTELAAAYSATRKDSPPFSPLQQIKKLFKRKGSPHQTSPTFIPWHDDDPSERPLQYPDQDIPGSPRPPVHDYTTPSGRTQGY